MDKKPENDLNLTILNLEERRKIGERLKALRKKKGFSSPDKFAYEHNINRSQYGKYEAGSEDMRLSSLIKVISLFDLTLSDFFNTEHTNSES